MKKMTMKKILMLGLIILTLSGCGKVAQLTSDSGSDTSAPAARSAAPVMDPITPTNNIIPTENVVPTENTTPTENVIIPSENVIPTTNVIPTVNIIPTVNKYTLIINKVGSGTIVVSPLKSDYTEGEYVTITSTQLPVVVPANTVGNSGTVFEGYTGDISNSGTSITICMTKNYNITSTFTDLYRIESSYRTDADPIFCPMGAFTLTFPDYPILNCKGLVFKKTVTSNAYVLVKKGARVKAIVSPGAYTTTGAGNGNTFKSSIFSRDFGWTAIEGVSDIAAGPYTFTINKPVIIYGGNSIRY